MGAMALLAAGCVPQRFVIDLSAGSPKLKESTVLADDGATRSTPKVALIHVSGFILDANEPQLLGNGPNPVDELVFRLTRAEKDKSVKAVVLRINSPGGTVTGSGIMAREVRRFAEKTGKPVVASMGEVAASGGYYLAVSADHIFAEPTTVTASIGVLMQTMNFTGTLKMIGASARAITSGPNKDMGNPFGPEREEQFRLMQGMIDEYYARFRGWVIERRPRFDAAASAWALDGRVITGADAQKIGLVDEVGGVREAFEEAKKLAKLPSARLVTYHAETQAAHTPYASAVVPPASSATAGPGQINLLQINAPGMMAGLGASGGFYYLWVPPAP